jgi:3-methyladenine DNA glycosylase AlkD
MSDYMLDTIINELKTYINEEKAKFLPHFFKTGKGGYGEHDHFLGVVVPDIRKVASKYYKEVNLDDISELLHNEYHEVRLLSLIILTYKMKKATVKEQKEIVNLYLKNTKYINNWDLVDLSAPLIVGAYLYNNKLDRSILYELANKDDLWSNRISILSTQFFIRNKDFNDTLEIAKILLHHEHDLIHKAVGWMLREVGNRDYNLEYEFLKTHYKEMPRTMLRYAIEKFKEDIRLKFLNNKI